MRIRESGVSKSNILIIIVVVLSVIGCAESEKSGKISTQASDEHSSIQNSESDINEKSDIKQSQVIQPAIELKARIETEVKLVPVIEKNFEPISYELGINGRPKDFYTLTYARDERLCSIAIHALNQTGLYNQGLGRATHQSDLLLRNRYSVDWLRLGTSSRALGYVEIDLDNNGSIDRITREIAQVGDTVYAAELSLSWTRFDQPTDNTFLDAKRMAKVISVYEERSQNYENLKDITQFGERIIFSLDTVDLGQAPKPTGAHFGLFGRFSDVLTIEGRNYILHGGSFSPSIIKANGNKPVYLMQMVGPKEHKVLCEFTARYKSKSMILR